MVAGGPENVAGVLRFLDEQGIKTKRNPDLYVKTYRHFGIDEARELRERAMLRPLGERRVFIIAAPDMNREAQNALLKTLEEPSGGALFFLIVPSPQMLLPTLRSRLQTIVLEGTQKERELVDVKQFLSALPQKRLDLLKPLLEKSDGDPSTGLGAGKRDLGAILSFLASLERELAKSIKAHATRREGIESVYRARKYVADRGALVKPLLEQMALLVPRI